MSQDGAIALQPERQSERLSQKLNICQIHPRGHPTPGAHPQQADVVCVGHGMVVGVHGESIDAKHLLGGLRGTQDVGAQHHQASAEVSAGRRWWVRWG